MRALNIAIPVLLLLSVVTGCENLGGPIETAIQTTKEYKSGLKLLEEADILLNRGELEASKRKAEQARVTLEQSVRTEPGNNRARLVLAQTLFVLGQVPEIESLALEQKAQESRAKGEKSTAQALTIESNQKRQLATPFYKAAEQHLQSVHHKLNQDDPSVPYVMGRIYTFFERWEDAQEMFEEALDRTPPEQRIFRERLRKVIRICEEEIAIAD